MMKSKAKPERKKGRVQRVVRRLVDAEMRAAVAEKKLGLAKACLQDISEGKWKKSARRTAKAVVDLLEWFGEPMEFVVSEAKPSNDPGERIGARKP